MDDRTPVNLRCSALVFRGDTVLLCRRTDEPDTWVLPGGTPGPGEGAASTARREVAEETGLQIQAERVAFVLETTSWDRDHALIEIVFLGADLDPRADAIEVEQGLAPAFIPLDDLHEIGLRPPIAGYIRGFAASRSKFNDPPTAAYLGNLWRPTDDDASEEITAAGS